MKNIYIIFVLGIIWGCDNSQEKIIIAQNNGKDIAFSGVTRLELDKANCYSLSYRPYDTVFSKSKLTLGKYIIRKDTLYLYENGSTLFKKAIFKQGFIEILDDNYRIKVIKNKISSIAKNEIIDNKDYALFTYTGNLEYIFAQGLSTDLDNKDIFKISEAIQEKIKDTHQQFNKQTNQETYVKQCIATINSNNEKIVWVNCIAKKSAKFIDWENEIINVKDGGNAYFSLKINLTTGEIFDFFIHGQA